MDAFQRFLSEPKKALATVRNEAQIISGLDPGVGHAERHWWAWVSGALDESDCYLTRNPLLTAVDSTAPDHMQDLKTINVT
jgi:hypothetical protein